MIIYLDVTRGRFSEQLRIKMFSRHAKKAKPEFSNSSSFEEHYRKALFSCKISVDGKPNGRNKAGKTRIPELRSTDTRTNMPQMVRLRRFSILRSANDQILALK